MILNKKLTVLLPVFNGEKYLKESIDSILNQTYKDFDLLIINDDSTDNSENIIMSYNDERIHYIKNNSNLGLISTLNIGLDLITSEYIARMDQDDISFSNRFKKQLKYMDKNPDIAVSGTSIEFFNEKGKKKKYKLPTSSVDIQNLLLVSCVLAHPSVIIRKSVVDKENYRYNFNHKNIEDFGLWQLISRKYKLSNLSEVLLKYRIVETGITKIAEKKIDERDTSHIMIYKQGFQSVGLTLSDSDYLVMRKLIAPRSGLTEDSLDNMQKLVLKILAQLEKVNRIEVLREFFARKHLVLLKFYFNDYVLSKKAINYSKEIFKYPIFSRFGLLQRFNTTFLLYFFNFFFKRKFFF